MSNFTPKDVVAVIVFSGIIIMKVLGADGSLDAAGALIIGYYFGHRTSGVDNGK